MGITNDDLVGGCKYLCFVPGKDGALICKKRFITDQRQLVEI